MATCRRVLENVGRLVELPSMRRSPEQRTQSQRWAGHYYDTKGLASAAHHEDKTTACFKWGPE
jgi:hypothetical protein